MREKELLPDGVDPQQVAELSGGSLARAVKLADESFREFRSALFEQLASVDWDPVDFPKLVNQFVEEAGKEAPKRRERLRVVIEWAIEFYAAMLHQLSSDEGQNRGALTPQTQSAAGKWRGNGETAATAIEICLNTESQIAANANLSTLVEAWLDDLAVTVVSGY